MKKQTIQLKGVYSALFTIYDEELNVKKGAVHKLMKYHQENGLQGFYVGGNSGEGMVLPVKTRMDMLEAVMEEKKDSTIISHIGAATLQDATELLKHADKCGVDVISSQIPVCIPAYNDDEIVEYYRYLSSMTDKPLLAYINGLIKGDVYDVAGQIMDIPNMIGVKMTIPNYYYFERLKTMNPDMVLLNGPDESLLAGLVMGADGGIGTSYNILPDTVADIYNYFVQGDMDKALVAQKKLNTLIASVAGKNIGHWKFFLELIGFDMGYTVAPATKVDETKRKEYEKVLGEL
ncbi:MAG: dihydrodipicolinate synthase family protein [Lachnospiraceae bacterium]|nr:dihydrodipicolinate synthase family protein [Lachnospiraceae bacterium]